MDEAVTEHANVLRAHSDGYRATQRSEKGLCRPDKRRGVPHAGVGDGENQSEKSLRAGEKRGGSEYPESCIDRGDGGGGAVVCGGGGRRF